MKNLLEIGQIVNTYGIKGFVKVVPYTDDITRFEQLKNVYIETKNGFEEVNIEEVKYSKNIVLLKFKGIDNINIAEKYRNCYIKIDRKDAIKLPENSYFIADLIGIDVFSDEGKFLGKVDDIFSTSSNDVYVIKDELGKQLLLPAIKDVIKNIDIENGRITVHLMPGLE